MLVFGAWLFGLLPIPAPFAYPSETDVVQAKRTIERALYSLTLLVVSPMPFIWLDTLLQTRRSPAAAMHILIKAKFRTWRGLMGSACVICAFGVALTVTWSNLDLRNSYFVQMEITIALNFLLIFLQPPTTIFLGSSSDPSAELLRTIVPILRPFRTVSLINRTWTQTVLGVENTFRTIQGWAWRSSVHELVEISPLVIVDARTASANVCEEVQYMLSSERAWKTLFVTNENGQASALEDAGVLQAIQPGQLIVRCTISSLTAEVGRLVSGRDWSKGAILLNHAFQLVGERALTEARPFLEECLKLEQRTAFAATVRQELARVLQESDDLDGAVRLRFEAKRLAPDRHTNLYQLALLLAQLERTPEALEESTAAMRLSPENPEYRRLVAQLDPRPRPEHTRHTFSTLGFELEIPGDWKIENIWLDSLCESSQYEAITAVAPSYEGFARMTVTVRTVDRASLNRQKVEHPGERRIMVAGLPATEAEYVTAGTVFRKLSIVTGSTEYLIQFGHDGDFESTIAQVIQSFKLL